MGVLEELKRRNVIRVGIAYVVTCWLLLQVADIVLDNLPTPDWVIQVLMLVMALGFPLVLLFAWAFELTPEGLRRESDVDRTKSITGTTGRKLDRLIIAALALALGYFVWESRFAGLEPAPGVAAVPAEAAASGVTAVDETPEKSIAVLPFVNLSSDSEQEFFSDGISEELLNVLAQYPGLHVAARTSSFQFKGQNRDIGEIARLLKVRHVLEGSVRKSGKQLRITAQLIQADTGYHLWSETFDREMDDVFAIQDEISAAIGDALRIKLALKEGAATAPQVAESSNTAAYEAFLHGRHLVNQRGRTNLEQATDDLKRAIRLDPDFAPAHAWLAIAWGLLLDNPTTYGDLTLAQVTERATPAIERAFELDPELAEAFGARGLLAMDTGRYKPALDDFERALARNPVNVDALNWSQNVATYIGDLNRATTLLERIIDIDPLSVIGRLNYAQVLAASNLEAGRQMARELMRDSAWAGRLTLGLIEVDISGDLAAGLRWLLLAYGDDPHDELVNRVILKVLSTVGLFDEARRITENSLFIVDVLKGDLEAALHELQTAAGLDPDNLALQTDLADVLYLSQRFEQALPIYERLSTNTPSGLFQSTTEQSNRPSLRLADILSRVGESDRARLLLEHFHRDLETRRSLQQVYHYDLIAEAMAFAIVDDAESSFTAIRHALDRGLRDPSVFREPVFDAMRQHPGFLGLQAEHVHLVEQQREAVLAMICHDNPIPGMWQPLAATCQGVEKRDDAAD